MTEGPIECALQNWKIMNYNYIIIFFDSNVLITKWLYSLICFDFGAFTSQVIHMDPEESAASFQTWISWLFVHGLYVQGEPHPFSHRFSFLNSS